MPFLGPIEHFIAGHVWCAWLVLVVMFIILAKCAGLFVDSAVTIASRFNVPKVVIGIVLVSFATTAPELSVSLIAAFKGNPEMALGNAIGSVICDDGLALGLAGIVSVAPIIVLPRVLKTSGIFLLIVQILTFLFVAFDYTLNRWEGAILVAMFCAYTWYLLRMHKRGLLKDEDIEEEPAESIKRQKAPALFLIFLIALAGIVFASEFIVVSATTIARSFSIPEAVISLTLVAFGTSVPEIATCITAAKKGHGEVAIGNILGADILNICWVAGASAIANDLTLTPKQVFFMFPSMFVIVGVMLLMLRHKHRLSKRKGIALICIYAIYLGVLFAVFPPELNKKNGPDTDKKEVESGTEETEKPDPKDPDPSKPIPETPDPALTPE